jgi:hypothetical protein
MKKVVLFAIMALCLSFSCKDQTPQEKLLELFKVELGSPTKEDLSDPKDLLYIWDNVDIQKGKLILGTADKALKMLPTEKKELAGSSDNFYDMNKYETPEYTIIVENHFLKKENDEYNIKVKLFIRNK